MKAWPVQDASKRFAEFLEACLLEGPQMVTRSGMEAAVLVPASEWHRLHARKHPTLKELLLSDEARTEVLAAPSATGRRRPAPPVE